MPGHPHSMQNKIGAPAAADQNHDDYILQNAQNLHCNCQKFNPTSDPRSPLQ